MLNNEQFAAAQKAQLATLMGLTATGIEATEKLFALNIDTAKAALAEAQAKAESAFSAKDVQSFFGAIWWTDFNVLVVMGLLIVVALVVGAIGSTLSVSWYLKT